MDQQDAVLLHLFPASLEDWQRKFERRIDDPQYFASLPERARQKYGIYSEVRSKLGMEALADLFDELCILKPNSVAIDQYPELFIEPDLDIEAARKKLVSPYITLERFEHLSQPAPEPIREEDRIFQIGMNRGGSKELCAMLGRKGYSYAHWDRGKLAKDLKAAKANERKPFNDYSHYQVLSDISYGSQGSDIYDGFYDVEYIHCHYPKSIYVLNFRPIEEWISSRARFRGGTYLQEHRAAYGAASDEEVFEIWRKEWTAHVERVNRLRTENNLRLVEYSLYTEKPSVFFERIDHLLADRPVN